MTKPSVYIQSIPGATFYLSTTTNPVPYSGSGTPWTSEATSPVEIAMNEVTGETFRITVPTPGPIINGALPFAVGTEQAIAVTLPLRTVTIPIQLHATTRTNLMDLRRILERRITVAPELSVGGENRLIVSYASRAVQMNIISGSFQDDGRFLNEESSIGLMLRGVLTLQCVVGEDTTPTSISATVNNPTTQAWPSFGDYAQSIGDPAAYSFLNFTTDPAARRIFLAAIGGTVATDSGALAESVATVSTAYVTSTGFVVNPADGSTRRVFAIVTNASANLRLRAITDTGIVGQEITPRTQAGAQIVDLGTLAVGNEVTNFLVQYRSSTGGATTGTLVRLRAISYVDYCVIERTNAVVLSQIDVDTEYTPPGDGIPISIRGRVPRAYMINALAGTGSFWAIWETNNVYNSAETATIIASSRPLRSAL